jgi:hypothetical protein
MVKDLSGASHFFLPTLSLRDMAGVRGKISPHPSLCATISLGKKEVTILIIQLAKI